MSKPRPATIIRRFLAGASLWDLAAMCSAPDPMEYVERAIRNALNRKRSKR